MPNLKTIAQLKNVENTEIIIANDDPIFAPIYKDALARQNMFITGSAGTGKSVITYNLISKLRAQGYKVGVGASTGVAGLILNASTIHKLLWLNIDVTPHQFDVRIKKMLTGDGAYIWNNFCKKIKSLDYIVIDEISMINCLTFDLIDYIIRRAEGFDWRSFRYGDVHYDDQPLPKKHSKCLILVGDVAQLEPVITPAFAEIYGIDSHNTWFFQSQSWKQGNYQTHNLTHIFRQDNVAFINYLNNVRLGIWKPEMQSIFDELNKPKSFEHTPLKIVSNNAEADFIAKQEIAKLNSDSVLYEAVVSGKTPILKQDIAKSCIAKEILELKVGERVICLKNDPDEEYVNGSLGTVINTLPDEVLVHFDNGNKCVIPRAFWEMKDQEGETIATFSQIPLNPAYAITSHKSQGMTLDSVIFDCRNLFTSSQYYVGISRVRDFHHLQTIGAQINQIKASPTAIAFIEEISKKQG